MSNRLNERTPLALPEDSGKVDYRAFSRVHHDIERLAYEKWLERGCPHGTQEDDWLRAEHIYWTLKRNAAIW